MRSILSNYLALIAISSSFLAAMSCCYVCIYLIYSSASSFILLILMSLWVIYSTCSFFKFLIWSFNASLSHLIVSKSCSRSLTSDDTLWNMDYWLSTDDSLILTSLYSSTILSFKSYFSFFMLSLSCLIIFMSSTSSYPFYLSMDISSFKTTMSAVWESFLS